MKRKINYTWWTIMRGICILVLIVSGYTSRGQSFTITGPDCVRIGVEYQYIISSVSDSLSQLQMCLERGVFSDTELRCIKDTMLTEVRVIWTDSLSGQLTLRSGEHSVTKVVNVARELHPGSVSKEMLVRNVKVSSGIDDIVFTNAMGGGCNPEYRYQWQQSDDNMHWKDLIGANQQTYRFIEPITRSYYFRRKVTDVNSGNFAYSAAIAIFFKPEEKLPN